MTVHDDHTSVNPFLAGNFAPVHDEVHVELLAVHPRHLRDLIHQLVDDERLGAVGVEEAEKWVKNHELVLGVVIGQVMRL